MKDYPQNKEQWADEAYQSMNLAWAVLTQTNPFPNDQKKQELIPMAVKFACENRDIEDPSYIKHAESYAMECFASDYESRDILQKINFALCYVLAYFDAHLSLSMITDEDSEDAINHLKTHYDLSFSENPKNNVFAVDFSKKNDFLN